MLVILHRASIYTRVIFKRELAERMNVDEQEDVAAGLWTHAEVPQKRVTVRWTSHQLKTLYEFRRDHCDWKWKDVATQVNQILGGTNFSRSSMEKQYKLLCPQVRESVVYWYSI